MTFRTSLLYEGPIPPSGGPHRARFLEMNGRQALSDADTSFAEVMNILGDKAAFAPSLHRPIESIDDGERRAVQREKRSEWIDFVITLDMATLHAIEPHIRRSETAAVAALNYLEDHALAHTAHEAIHRAAFVRRGLFGCPIVLHDDGKYWTDCAVNMSHLRAGMSAEIVSDFECSICGHLVEDCEHIMNYVYEKTAERDGTGSCTVCAAVGCDHEIGLEYPVIARGLARNMAAEGVALVARPRYPLARIDAQTIDLDDLGDSDLMREAADQRRLHCDACLGPCRGLNDMRAWGVDLEGSVDADGFRDEFD
jgi:hypothetical protein